ncbi:hypothetical protein M3B01_06030 [Brachybacterium sp. p3-SID957]|nr:hypothetical protein [Brachybacterium sp. p3-SID957]MCT1775634.1 hypothetical protein [Brachybacterium sp. p3-SID957]
MQIREDVVDRCSSCKQTEQFFVDLMPCGVVSEEHVVRALLFMTPRGDAVVRIHDIGERARDMRTDAVLTEPGTEQRTGGQCVGKARLHLLEAGHAQGEAGVAQGVREDEAVGPARRLELKRQGRFSDVVNSGQPCEEGAAVLNVQARMSLDRVTDSAWCPLVPEVTGSACGVEHVLGERQPARLVPRFRPQSQGCARQSERR